MNCRDESTRKIIHQHLAEARKRNRILEEEQKKEDKNLEELDKIDHEYKEKRKITHQQLAEARKRSRILGEEQKQQQQKLEEIYRLNHEFKGKIQTKLNDRDLESFRYMYECFVDLKRLNAKEVTRSDIKIFVDNNFCLQHLFDNLSSTSCATSDKSFLFRGLSSRQGIHHHAPKLIADWSVLFKHKYERFAMHHYKGGIREFLSRTWDQIQTLKVRIPGSDRQVALFEETEVGYIPVLDDKFCSSRFGAELEQNANVDQMIIQKAKMYYRAIGRIMLHSIMTKHSISDRAMPRFYQNVLFRECNFKDDRYPRSEILEDLEAMRGTDDELGSYVGNKLSLCGIEGDDADMVITPELFFTRVVDHQHVRSRSIGIGAIKEGLTLNGYVDVQCFFRGMPIDAVSKLIFAKAKVNPEDVIRVLRPEYSTHLGPNIVKTQEHFFENVLKKVIRDRAKVDDTFLPDFVRNCTGLSYVPHILARPDFRIVIGFCFETMDNDSLPVAHTCVNELRLPGFVYDGDRETFEKKLDQSLAAFCEIGFTMF